MMCSILPWNKEQGLIGKMADDVSLQTDIALNAITTTTDKSGNLKKEQARDPRNRK